MRTFFWLGVSYYLLIFSVIIMGKFHPGLVYAFPPAQKARIYFAAQTPVCLDRSNIPDEELHWLYIPKDASELATNEDYGYLSGQLIQSGVVNASDCPFGGLWPSGYANSCGLERTRQASLYLQNVYDDEILAAGTSFGVPPVMIKQLIRYESQFWPIPMGFTHFGLGHLTYMGAANALLWSRDLFETAYAQAPEPKIDMPSNVLKLLDASCPTCQFKVDVPKAEQSITYIAEILMGYCKQTSQVVLNATGTSPGNAVDYATIWKLTLLSYNSGPLCVYNAVNETYSGDPITWDDIVANVDGKACQVGVRYVNNITAPYYEFTPTP